MHQQSKKHQEPSLHQESKMKYHLAELPDDPYSSFSESIHGSVWSADVSEEFDIPKYKRLLSKLTSIESILIFMNAYFYIYSSNTIFSYMNGSLGVKPSI